MTLLFGADQAVAQWVRQQLHNIDPGPCAAIGIVRDNRLIAGVVYNNYIESPDGRPVSIEGTIASIDPAWCTKRNLHALFFYPFVTLGVARFQATTARKNKKARQFLVRLGFTLDGMARQAWPLGGDAAVYSMLKPECRYI